MLLSQWCDRLSLIGCESEALELAPRTTNLASPLAQTQETSRLAQNTTPNQLVFTPHQKTLWVENFDLFLSFEHSEKI